MVTTEHCQEQTHTTPAHTDARRADNEHTRMHIHILHIEHK